MRSDHLVGLVEIASSGHCIIAQVGSSLVIGGLVGEPSNVRLKESNGGLLILESNAFHKWVSTRQLTQGGNLFLPKIKKVFGQIILATLAPWQSLDEIGWIEQLLYRIGSSRFKLEHADARLEDSSIDV